MEQPNFYLLTNRYISDNYRDRKWYFFPSDFMGALAYWVVAQNSNIEEIETAPIIKAFKKYIFPFFNNRNFMKELTYQEVYDIIYSDKFKEIPEITALNRLEPEFIDLDALARNVFYMIIRTAILNDDQEAIKQGMQYQFTKK